MEKSNVVKPISPSDVKEGVNIPHWVIEGANECIQANYHQKISHFTQDKLIEYIMKYAPAGTTRQSLFTNHWLDIEPLYREVGWKVEYDKPAYCENYPANFTFTEK